MPKLYIYATEPGFARVGTTPNGYRGVRMPIADLIRDLARRGRPS